MDDMTRSHIQQVFGRILICTTVLLAVFGTSVPKTHAATTGDILSQLQKCEGLHEDAAEIGIEFGDKKRSMKEICEFSYGPITSNSDISEFCTSKNPAALLACRYGYGGALATNHSNVIMRFADIDAELIREEGDPTLWLGLSNETFAAWIISHNAAVAFLGSTNAVPVPNIPELTQGGDIDKLRQDVAKLSATNEEQKKALEAKKLSLDLHKAAWDARVATKAALDKMLDSKNADAEWRSAMTLSTRLVDTMKTKWPALQKVLNSMALVESEQLDAAKANQDAIDSLERGSSVSLSLPLSDIDPAKVIGRIIRAILGIVGALGLAGFVYGGILYMTASGNADQAERGRKTIIWSVLGLAVIFAAYGIVNFIIEALT